MAAATVLLSLPACTAPTSPQSRSQSAKPSQAAPGSTLLPSHETVRLSCADAGTGITPTDADSFAADGITLEGGAGDTKGSLPAEVGVSVRTNQTLYFLKTPAYLKAGATATIELSPASGGYLAWVPARTWTSATGAVKLAPWMTSKVVFDGCPDRDSTYFGGLLSTNPNMCLELPITEASGKSQQIPVGSATHC